MSGKNEWMVIGMNAWKNEQIKKNQMYTML